MQLVGGQPVERFDNGLVAQLEGLLNGLALDHLGGHGRGGHGCAAAKGLEFDVHDHVVFDLEHHLHDVAALLVAHHANGVGVRQLAHVAGMGEVIHDLFGILHVSVPPLYAFQMGLMARSTSTTSFSRSKI